MCTSPKFAREVALAMAFLLALATSAQAQTSGWRISTTRDRMNDRDVKYAELAAKTADRGIVAVLGLMCSKELNVGRAFTMTLSREIFTSRINGSYRLDNEPEQLRNFYVINGLIAFVEAPPFDLIGRKRFRVQVSQSNQAPLFYDFDLTGLAAVAKTLGCR